MGTVSVSLPSDGQTIDAADYNTPINTIVTAVNGNLDSNNIAEGGVVPNSLTDGTGTSWVWQDWTPSYTGITVGNGTAVAKYMQIGKTVHFYYQLIFGSTSSISSGIMSLPVTATSNLEVAKAYIGNASMDDDNGSQFGGFVRLESTTDMRPLVPVATSTYTNMSGVSASIPFAWTTLDGLIMTGTYEAA